MAAGVLLCGFVCQRSFMQTQCGLACGYTYPLSG